MSNNYRAQLAREKALSEEGFCSMSDPPKFQKRKRNEEVELLSDSMGKVSLDQNVAPRPSKIHRAQANLEDVEPSAESSAILPAASVFRDIAFKPKRMRKARGGSGIQDPSVTALESTDMKVESSNVNTVGTSQIPPITYESMPITTEYYKHVNVLRLQKAYWKVPNNEILTSDPYPAIVPDTLRTLVNASVMEGGVNMALKEEFVLAIEKQWAACKGFHERKGNYGDIGPIPDHFWISRARNYLRLADYFKENLFYPDELNAAQKALWEREERDWPSNKNKPDATNLVKICLKTDEPNKLRQVWEHTESNKVLEAIANSVIEACEAKQQATCTSSSKPYPAIDSNESAILPISNDLATSTLSNESAAPTQTKGKGKAKEVTIVGEWNKYLDNCHWNKSTPRQASPNGVLAWWNIDSAKFPADAEKVKQPCYEARLVIDAVYGDAQKGTFGAVSSPNCKIIIPGDNMKEQNMRNGFFPPPQSPAFECSPPRVGCLPVHDRYSYWLIFLQANGYSGKQLLWLSGQDAESLRRDSNASRTKKSTNETKAAAGPSTIKKATSTAFGTALWMRAHRLRERYLKPENKYGVKGPLVRGKGIRKTKNTAGPSKTTNAETQHTGNDEMAPTAAQGGTKEVTQEQCDSFQFGEDEVEEQF